MRRLVPVLVAIASLALAGFSVLAALLFHANFADRSQVLHFEKDLAIAGGLLVLFAFGPGRFSFERRASVKQTPSATHGMTAIGQ